MIKKKRKYIKYYKVKIENAKMIIIMWEKVWNERERERERERDVCYSCKPNC